MRALVVEDQRRIARFLERGLSEEGFAVDVAYDGHEGLAFAEQGHYDLLVLDVVLPGRDGLAVCAELRRQGNRVPILMLTARDTVADRIAGLDSGADDYLVKPFSQRELVARIAAVLRRRASSEPARALRFGSLVIDTAAREVFVLSRPMALTRLEYELLVYLARNPGRSFSREQLLSAVWGSSSDWQSAETVSEHVYRLRQKLGLGSERPRIATVRGIGYRFDP